MSTREWEELWRLLWALKLQRLRESEETPTQQDVRRERNGA